MSYWMEHRILLDHYYSLLHEAEQYQLARQALEGRPKKPTIWCKGMSWFGVRLSAWGDHLQERYGYAA
jgi:hypothetical protein